MSCLQSEAPIELKHKNSDGAAKIHKLDGETVIGGSAIVQETGAVDGFQHSENDISARRSDQSARVMRAPRSPFDHYAGLGTTFIDDRPATAPPCQCYSLLPGDLRNRYPTLARIGDAHEIAAGSGVTVIIWENDESKHSLALSCHIQPHLQEDSADKPEILATPSFPCITQRSTYFDSYLSFVKCYIGETFTDPSNSRAIIAALCLLTFNSSSSTQMRFRLFLFLLAATTIRAADVAVFPEEFIVPQCSMLKASRKQTHLHVQPGDSIAVSNLVDLGVQNNAFTTFQVALSIGESENPVTFWKLMGPSGQNFTFAFNTIADQFTVFQFEREIQFADVMQVGPGTTDCLTASAPRSTTSSTFISARTSKDTIVPKTTQSPPARSITRDPASSTGSSAPVTSISLSTQSISDGPATNSGSSASESSSPAITSASIGSATGSTRMFPIGVVVGSICGLAGIILLGLALFWHHRRSMLRLAYLHPERENPASDEAIPERNGAVIPYQQHIQMRDPQKAQTRRFALNPPPTQADRGETDSGESIVRSEEGPPAYHDYSTTHIRFVTGRVTHASEDKKQDRIETIPKHINPEPSGTIQAVGELFDGGQLRQQRHPG
ncbi:hypothetical protein DFH09DRAFT_1113764 [Mycena vulgaris]|nr:hypothetical protein DFH09DRAFT_1113764 [Mycena vulgaris]